VEAINIYVYICKQVCNPTEYDDFLLLWPLGSTSLLAANPIQALVDEGMVSGYPDHTFKPDNEVNRAEFVTLAGGNIRLLP
jgi:hypothetical protein